MRILSLYQDNKFIGRFPRYKMFQFVDKQRKENRWVKFEAYENGKLTYDFRLQFDIDTDWMLSKFDQEEE